jgi:hypothetical protein
MKFQAVLHGDIPIGQALRLRPRVKPEAAEICPDYHTRKRRPVPQRRPLIEPSELRLSMAMGHTAQRLHMHRPVKPRPHHLRDAARIVAVRLLDRADF